MNQEQIEAVLKQTYKDGHTDTGLYDAGIRYGYVVMGNVDGQLTFQWFRHMQTVDAMLAGDPIEIRVKDAMSMTPPRDLTGAVWPTGQIDMAVRLALQGCEAKRHST